MYIYTQTHTVTGTRVNIVLIKEKVYSVDTKRKLADINS